MKHDSENLVTDDDWMDHFTLLSYNLSSAVALHVAALNVITANINIPDGTTAYKQRTDQWIRVLAKLRDALYSGAKCLVKINKSTYINSQDIKEMWEKSILAYHNVLPAEMNRAFLALAKYNMLAEPYLPRHHSDKGIDILRYLQATTNEDVNALMNAAWAIRNAILICIHIQKGLPIH